MILFFSEQKTEEFMGGKVKNFMHIEYYFEKEELNENSHRKNQKLMVVIGSCIPNFLEVLNKRMKLATNNQLFGRPKFS